MANDKNSRARGGHPPDNGADGPLPPLADVLRDEPFPERTFVRLMHALLSAYAKHEGFLYSAEPGFETGVGRYAVAERGVPGLKGRVGFKFALAPDIPSEQWLTVTTKTRDPAIVPGPTDSELNARIWPRRFSDKNTDFRPYVDILPRGRAFAEHPVRIRRR